MTIYDDDGLKYGDIFIILPFSQPFSRAVHPGMPRLQVHPIASAALDVDLDDGTTLAALKRALAERTGIAVEEQRLVLRGKLLEETAGAGVKVELQIYLKQF